MSKGRLLAFLPTKKLGHRGPRSQHHLVQRGAYTRNIDLNARPRTG
jgi:hypothetical protein